MPENTTNLFNLGSLGVNVDDSPIHLEDGEFTSAQNCTQDKRGMIGGVTKRAGLTKYQPTVAAGSILGFVPAPLGPGPGTGTDDATIYYVANTAGTWFKSSNSFGASTAVTTLAAAAGNDDIRGDMLNRRLIYATASRTNLRVFDGVGDALFATIGDIITFVGAYNGRIFVSIDGSAGAVYEIDNEGRVTQIGADIPGGFVPQ